MVSKLDSFLFTLPAFFCASAALPQLPLPSCPQTDRSAALPRYLPIGADAVCAFLYRNQRGDGILHRRHCFIYLFCVASGSASTFLTSKIVRSSILRLSSCIASQIQAVRISDDLCQGTDIRFRSRVQACFTQGLSYRIDLFCVVAFIAACASAACLPVLLP